MAPTIRAGYCGVPGCPRQSQQTPTVVVVRDRTYSGRLCPVHGARVKASPHMWHTQVDPLEATGVLLRPLGYDPDTGGFWAPR
jgi:hypothetical protein